MRWWSATRRLVARSRRRLIPSDGFSLLMLTLASVLLAALSVRFAAFVPVSALVLALLAGGVLLTFRSLVLLYFVIGLLLVWTALKHDGGDARVLPGVVAVLVIAAVGMLVLARSRFRLGVAGTRGESMLVDLRDRIRAHGELPPLPECWGAEVVLRSAYGASFSGDFVVATRSADRRRLEMALVDVSGKGADAGTRALLLSGAFGGLLGAMPDHGFLPAANNYLLRQQWSEGFATAVHLVVDLETGDYRVTSAGHPPAAHFAAGSGQWRLIEEAHGPLLGVIEDGTFTGEEGRLAAGDAMLLYTDGLIEAPGRDLALGIDRLVGEAERLVTRGFEHGARRLVDAIGSSAGDDRALVLLWRN